MSTPGTLTTPGSAGEPRRAGTVLRVGIVGAGQLARMTHRAAIDLGIEVVVLATSADEPAVAAGATCRLGSPEVLEDLAALAAACDVVTFDHERIPTEHLEALERRGIAVRPAAQAALAAQDKLHARRLLGDELGLPVPAFAPVEDAAAVARFALRHGWPVVLKARRGGYDGRGVAMVHTPGEAEAVLATGGEWLAEACVPLDLEVAAMVARSPSGELVSYPVVETVQAAGMCRELRAPAAIPPALAEEAQALARLIAERLGATGILAVELFVSDGRLLVNELALRPHNSGHWTIEGAATSQFENHLRGVLDLPLGETTLRAPAVATVNVVGPRDGGDPRARLAAALAVPGAQVHLYGKAARPGRKLGHVTALAGTAGAAREIAQRAAGALGSPA
ncbi:MAG: 5-(carboxyamino)imidazole ribonucleotide synthase [Solirubrobacteraceae bacterium]|nr:5-(carboxyamino)imidazole ribonucleotide synthase [Solirubrobacteraceae bacterium]